MTLPRRGFQRLVVLLVSALCTASVGCLEWGDRAEAEWIYEGEQNVVGYALLGDTLYFSEQDNLYALDVVSGERELIAERSGTPRDLVTVDNTLLWRERDSIWGMELPSGTPVELEADGYGLRQAARGYAWFSGDEWVEVSSDLSTVTRTRVWFWTDWLATLSAEPELQTRHTLHAVVGDQLYFTTSEWAGLGGFAEDRTLWKTGLDPVSIPQPFHRSDGSKLRYWDTMRASPFGVTAFSHTQEVTSWEAEERSLWVYGDAGDPVAVLPTTSARRWVEHDGSLYFGDGFAVFRWSPSGGLEEMFFGLMTVDDLFFHDDQLIMASLFGFKVLPLDLLEPRLPSDE